MERQGQSALPATRGGAGARRWRPATCSLILVLAAATLLSACSRSRTRERERAAATRAAESERAARGDGRRGETELPAASTLPPLPPSDSAGKAGASGGILKVHLEAEPPHLNPLGDAHQVIARVVNGLVYEPLLECRGADYTPALAESWEVSSDGLRVLLRVRPGVLWHDDRPLTAVDVQATLEGVLRSTSRAPVQRASLADVAAIELLPGGIVRLRLHRPAPIVLRALCDVPILPEALTRGDRAVVAQLSRQPVGTGPFRFAGWERGKRIRLARNPQSWRGAPRLDEIVFEIDGDPVRALARVRRGDLDILPRVAEVHYPDQVTPAAVGERVELVKLTPQRYSLLLLNHRREPLHDARFRRALSLLWNRGKLAEELHRGLATPIGAPPYGDVPAPAFDLAGATRLLDEAGYVDTNGDGVRERTGVPVRLTFVHPAGVRGLATEARRYAADLRRAGLLLELVPVDSGAVLDRLKSGQFDLAPIVWEGRTDEDPRPLFGLHGELNHGGYRSDRVQALLDEMRSAASPTARVPIAARLAAALAEELPVVFLYRHATAALVARRVHGLSEESGSIDLRFAWVDP